MRMTLRGARSDLPRPRAASVTVRSSYRAPKAGVEVKRLVVTRGKNNSQAGAHNPSRLSAARTAPRPRPLALVNPMTTYHLLIGAMGLLLALGLIMVLSASSVSSYRRFGSSFSVFEKQAMWVVVGLPLLWVASRLPVRMWRRLAYPALIGCMILLMLVPFFGVEINGNRNWLSLGGIKIQPSEPAKLALILFSADLLARKQPVLHQVRHLVIPLLPVGLFMVGLVLLGDDLGTSLVLMAIVLGIVFFAGAPFRVFAAVFAAAVLAVAVLAQASPNRVARITAWLPWHSTDDQLWGYQALHAKFALGSGGWWGLGLGAGREKWGGLPEAHNDFIFAVIGEELGLVGTVAVLVLFALLAVAGLRIARSATDPFVRLAAGGVTVWITSQAMINMAVALGLLPVIGIPLPLVSYGGSALLPTLVGLGMLVAFSRADYRATLAQAGARDVVRRSRLRTWPTHPGPNVRT